MIFRRRRRRPLLLAGLGRCLFCGVEVGAAHECAIPGNVARRDLERSKEGA